MQIKSIQEVQTYWNEFSSTYTNCDSAQSNFYFSLVNMLKLETRDSILEVGCGGGFLYDHILARKKQAATYVSTDLCENMLKKVCQRQNIPYVEGGVSENKDKNLLVRQADAEILPFEGNQFDCYIANLVIQITPSAEKMLQEAFRVLKSGGVIGFSTLGNKENSTFVTVVTETLQQYGISSMRRSFFHLNDREKLIQMVEKAGFSNVICWNQFSPFPFTNENDIPKLLEFHKVSQTLKEQLPEKEQEVTSIIIGKLKNILGSSKYPIGQDGLLLVAMKP